MAAGEIGYPVTLKSSDPLIRRRVDQSGVRLGLTNADQVAAAYADLTPGHRSGAVCAGDGPPRSCRSVDDIRHHLRPILRRADLLRHRWYRHGTAERPGVSSGTTHRCGCRRPDQRTACGATARWLPGHPACRNRAPGRPRVEVVRVGRRPAGGRGTAAPPGPLRARRDRGDQRDRAHRAAVRAVRHTPTTELIHRSRLGPPPRSGLGYSRQHVLYEPPRAVHRSKGSTRTPAQANTATTETIGLSCGTPCLFVKRMGSPECPPDRCHWSWISSGSSRLP